MLPVVVFSEVPLEFPLSWVITPLPAVPAVRVALARVSLSPGQPAPSFSFRRIFPLAVRVCGHILDCQIDQFPPTTPNNLICSRRQLVPADSPKRAPLPQRSPQVQTGIALPTLS